MAFIFISFAILGKTFILFFKVPGRIAFCMLSVVLGIKDGLRECGLRGLSRDGQETVQEPDGLTERCFPEPESHSHGDREGVLKIPAQSPEGQE